MLGGSAQRLSYLKPPMEMDPEIVPREVEGFIEIEVPLPVGKNRCVEVLVLIGWSKRTYFLLKRR